MWKDQAKQRSQAYSRDITGLFHFLSLFPWLLLLRDISHTYKAEFINYINNIL